VRVAAICDQEPAARKRAAQRHPGTTILSDCHDMLKDPRIDAIVIATPVRTHYDLALAALRAGKHVMIEKPMTQTAAQAEHLIEEAAKRKLTIIVDHTFVYTPAVNKIREMIAAGELGQVYYYDSTRVNLGLFQKDVNVIWDLAVHDFAILEYILNEQPISIAANGARHIVGNPENMAHITLQFGSGAMAHINVNWLAPVKVRQTLVGGSRRMIVYDDLQPSEKIKVYDRGVMTSSNEEEIYQMLVGYRIGDMYAPHLPATEALRTEVKHFADCIATGATPITDGAMGLRIVRLLEGATLSMQRHGHPIELTEMRRAS
jgi:predicted dehydrogenase